MDHQPIHAVGVTGNAIGAIGYHQSQLENMKKQKSESIKYDGAHDPKMSAPSDAQAHQAAINSRITRKLEGGRPHKVYDYMFI